MIPKEDTEGKTSTTTTPTIVHNFQSTDNKVIVSSDHPTNEQEFKDYIEEHPDEAPIIEKTVVMEDDTNKILTNEEKKEIIETAREKKAEETAQRKKDNAILDNMGLKDAYGDTFVEGDDIYTISKRTGEKVDIGDVRSDAAVFGSYGFKDSGSGVRILDPSTGISEDGVFEDGEWKPQGTKQLLENPTVTTRTTYDPFQMMAPVTDNYGKLTNKPAWVLGYDTPVIYEPGSSGYELAVGPTGKKLDMWGGYDPKRGVFVVSGYQRAGDIDTLGEVMVGSGSYRTPELYLEEMYGKSRLDEFAGYATSKVSKRTFVDVTNSKQIITYDIGSHSINDFDINDFKNGGAILPKDAKGLFSKTKPVSGTVAANVIPLGVGELRSTSEVNRDTLWGKSLPKLEIGGMDVSPLWSVIKPFALPGVSLSNNDNGAEYFSLGELFSPAFKHAIGNKGVAAMEQGIINARIANAETVNTPMFSLSRKPETFQYQLVGFTIAETSTPQIPGTGWYYDQPKIPGTSIRVSPQWSVLYTAGTEINQHIEDSIGGVEKVVGKGPVQGITLGAVAFVAEAPASVLQLAAGNMAIEAVVQNPGQTVEYAGKVGNEFIAGQQYGLQNDFWRTATMDALMVGTLATGIKGGLNKARGVAVDPLYEGVSRRTFTDRAVWTAQAAYDIYKVGPGQRKVLASDLVIGWVAERTPLRTNVQPTFTDLANVKPEWSGAIEKTLIQHQGRVGGSAALSSELRNLPPEVRAGLDTDLALTGKDIDLHVKPGDAMTFAEDAVKNIRESDPTAQIWISKGQNVSANVKAIVDGRTVTVFDIKALETMESGSGYGLSLEKYYNLAPAPLERQLYTPGELGYTGEIPSTTMPYLIQRKTNSAFINAIFEPGERGYRMVKDTADVIGPGKAIQAYWSARATNPMDVRSRFYSWISDKSIKTISEHKYTFTGMSGEVESMTGAEMYLTRYPSTMQMQQIKIADKLRTIGNNKFETGAIFDNEGNLIGGIKYGDSGSIRLVSNNDILQMERGVQQGKAYQAMHYHPGMDKDALIPSYSDVTSAAWEELDIGSPIKQSIAHYKGSDVYFRPDPGEASFRVKLEMQKFKYATYAGLGHYGKAPQYIALQYIKIRNSRVSPPIDLTEFDDILTTADRIYTKNRVKPKNTIKEEPIYNIVEESPIKPSKYSRSVYNSKLMKGGAISKISNIKNIGKPYNINSQSKILSDSPAIGSSSPVIKPSRINASTSVKPYTHPYKGVSSVYSGKGKSSGGNLFSSSPYDYSENKPPESYASRSGKFFASGGGNRGNPLNIIGGMDKHLWRNQGVLSDMMGELNLDFGTVKRRRSKRRGRKK